MRKTAYAAFWLGWLGVVYFYIYPQLRLGYWHVYSSVEPIVWQISKF